MGQHDDKAEELVKELGVGVEVPLVCFAIGVYLISGTWCLCRLFLPRWWCRWIRQHHTNNQRTNEQTNERQATSWSARRSSGATG